LRFGGFGVEGERVNRDVDEASDCVQAGAQAKETKGDPPSFPLLVLSSPLLACLLMGLGGGAAYTFVFFQLFVFFLLDLAAVAFFRDGAWLGRGGTRGVGRLPGATRSEGGGRKGNGF